MLNFILIEDTFLLLDALEKDADFLRCRGIHTVLEMGYHFFDILP